MGNGNGEARGPKMSTAMILCAGRGLETSSELSAALAACPGLSPGIDGASPLLDVGQGRFVTAMRIDAPPPSDAFESAVQYAWYWQQVRHDMQRVGSHLILSVGDEAGPKARAALLGRLVAAALAALPQAIAITWMDSNSIWPTSLAAAALQSEAAVPLPLCVAVKLMRDDAGLIAAFTTGMSVFGLMEIETAPRATNASKFAQFVFEFACYIFEAGPVVEDGETIGPDADTKFSIRHRESIYLPGTKVYWIEA